MEKNVRDKTLDFIRAFAIISIIFCHSLESYYYIFQDRIIFWNMLTLQSKIFNIIGITFGRIGVPLFLFLTGILVINKRYKSEDECIRNLHRKKFISLLLTLEIWVIIWNIFAYLFFIWRGEPCSITILSAIKNIFMISRVEYILPAWYVPMVLAIYVLIPYINILLNKLKFKQVIFPLILMIAVFFIIPNITTFTSNDANSFFGGTNVLWTCLVYVIIGYYVYKGILRKYSKLPLILILFISIIACMYLQFSLLQKNIPYKLEYNNIFLLIISVILLELILRMYKNKNRVFNKGCEYLSTISFPLFLVHNLVQYAIYQFGIFNSFKRPIAVLLMFILSTLISILIVKIISLSKKLKRILFRL